jgi:hypothetical protein
MIYLFLSAGSNVDMAASEMGWKLAQSKNLFVN